MSKLACITSHGQGPKSYAVRSTVFTAQSIHMASGVGSGGSTGLRSNSFVNQRPVRSEDKEVILKEKHHYSCIYALVVIPWIF